MASSNFTPPCSSSSEDTYSDFKYEFDFRDGTQFTKYLRLLDQPLLPTCYLDEDSFFMLDLFDDIHSLCDEIE